MSQVGYILGLNFGVVGVMMLIGWLLSLVYRNVTVVDSLWGLGFVLIAWITFFLSDGFIGRRTLILLLVTLWGLRLSVYLTRRNWGAGEDPRYGQWRKKAATVSGWSAWSKCSCCRRCFCGPLPWCSNSANFPRPRRVL